MGPEFLVVPKLLHGPLRLRHLHRVWLVGRTPYVGMDLCTCTDGCTGQNTGDKGDHAEKSKPLQR